MGSLALSRDLRDGAVRDLDHPGRELGGRDSFAARGKLRAILTPNAEILFSADASARDQRPLSYNKVLAATPAFRVDDPAGFWDVRTSSETRGRLREGGASLRARWQVTGSLEVQSLTAARWIDYDVQFDSDFSELALFATASHQLAQQFSEELTATGKGHRFAWIAGLRWFGERDRQPTETDALARGVVTRVSPDARTGAGSAFGQASYTLAPGLSLTAGLRRGVEHKRMMNDILVYARPTGTIVPGTSAAYDTRKSMDAWTPKLGAEWRSARAGLAYVSVARGFKSGGYNPTAREPGEGYAPEWATTIEAGLKRSLGGPRGWVHVLAFHTDYRDLQVQTTIRPGVLDIRNAAEADIHGAELEAGWRAARSLQLEGSLAWLDARYERYLALRADGSSFDAADRRLNSAPPWSGRAAATWTTSAGRAGTLSIAAEVQALARHFFSPSNDDVQSQGAYAVIHARAALEARSKRWVIGLFGRNLANQPFLIGTVSSSPVGTTGHPGESRSVGVEFSVRR
jgi:iron complex outermembrane receptor protein